MSKATETAKKAAESSASATANTDSNLVVGQWNSLRSVKTHNPDALKKDDLWSVPPQALEEEPGFNVRGSFLDGDYFETPEAKERIESLAQAYTDGRFVPPITVKVKDGHIYVRDGAHRRRALLLAISRGADIKRVTVIELKGNDADQELLLATANEGLQLHTLDRAALYQRQLAYGFTASEIAQRFGRSVTHVLQLLEMCEMPRAMLTMVRKDQVSATYALELFKQHGGTNALAMLQKELEALTDTSGATSDAQAKQVRVTKKKVEQGGIKITKKTVNVMRDTFVSLDAAIEKAELNKRSGKFTVVLDADMMDKLMKLREVLNPKEDASATDDKQASLLEEAA